MTVTQKFIRYFAPEQWDSAQKFSQFMGPPFKLDNELIKGTSTVISHLQKYKLLAQLAGELSETVEEDNRELEREGFTPARRSLEFGALIEASLSELYSVIDGLRRIIFSVYQGIKKVQNKSTKQLFERAAQNEYGSEFPEEIRQLLTTSYTSWFTKLRLLRTENTHGRVGSCYLNRQTGSIIYMHPGILKDGKALIIENIVDYMNDLAKNVIELIENIFVLLYSQLESKEHEVLCGIYKGRFYQRMVAVSSDLSFNSGRCLSVNWFKKEDDYICPMISHCGAYKNPVTEIEFKKIKPT